MLLGSVGPSEDTPMSGQGRRRTRTDFRARQDTVREDSRSDDLEVYLFYLTFILGVII